MPAVKRPTTLSFLNVLRKPPAALGASENRASTSKGCVTAGIAEFGQFAK
jgi:hypothetical protein